MIFFCRGNFFQTSFLEYHDSLCMIFVGFSFMVSGVFPSTSLTTLSALPGEVFGMAPWPKSF